MNNQAGGLEPPVHANILSEDLPTSQKTDNYKRNIDFQNKYKPSDTGPYFVYVEHRENNIGRLFPVRVGHYLFTNHLFKNHIEDIKSIGINRVKIIVKSAKVANELVNNEILTSKNLISYIPKVYTHKKGIIRMVDTFLDEDFILSNIESDIEVTEAKRMTRKMSDNEGHTKIIKRQIVILTFLGSSLPKSVKLNLCNFPVDPYIYPVVQCYKCLRYGHTEKLCRSDVRCCYCSEEHPKEQCQRKDTPQCVFCKTEDHSSVAKNCPEYIKQRSIKQTMATQNLSFREAESIVNNPSYAKVVNNNRFAVLSDLNNFPNLPSTSQGKSTTPYSPPLRPKLPVNTQQYRKRKAGKSPERTNKPPPLRKESQPVIPNPYREEFRAYRSKLVEQISAFINGLIINFFPEPAKYTEVINELNVKESLITLLSNPENSSVNSQNEQSDDDEY